jgi:hypothetical protein
MDMTQDEKDAYDAVRGYVSEGTVTKEIESDLAQLGWQVTESHDE